MFQRALRWDAEAAGSSHLKVVVIGRRSEPRSSPAVHSVQVDQALLTAVMSGVLRPPMSLYIYIYICGGAVVEDAGVLGEKPVFYQCIVFAS